MHVGGPPPSPYQLPTGGTLSGVFAWVDANERQEKFTEPVALLSTQPADLPLPRRALGRSFNLLALRARCEQEAMHSRLEGQDTPARYYRSLRRFQVARCSIVLIRLPDVLADVMAAI